MIDIHSHILPNTDDGARNIEESIAIARQESGGGTTVIFATPHIYNVTDFTKSPAFVQSVADLQTIFDGEGIDIRVAPGAEVYPMMDILKALDSGLPITMASKSRHMLLDLPLGQWPMIMEELTFELMAAGVTPILAHPERTAPVQESVEFLIPYLERGVLCQVNAGSLNGKYGPQAQRRANEIVSRKWASFLASDIHRASQNGPALRNAKARLSESPAEYVEQITVRNPGHVLEGTSLPPTTIDTTPPPVERKFFGGLFKKRG